MNDINNGTLWLTGLPCSGKTTLGARVKEKLDALGYKVVHLDGDDVRAGLSADLGFSEKDRKENLRRIAHVARLFNNNGNIVIASFVSPTNELREMVKKIIGKFELIYVKCSIKTCEKRDAKGMYKRARAGEIKEFTGVSAVFEEPRAAIVIDTENKNAEDSVKELLEKIGISPGPVKQ